MIRTDDIDAAQAAPKHLIAGPAWDPADDELDERWARLESAWEGMPPNQDPTGRHLVRFAPICAALIALGVVLGMVGFAMSQV